MCPLQRNSAKQNNADYSNTLSAPVKYNSSRYLDLVKKAPVFVFLPFPSPLISVAGSLRPRVAASAKPSNKRTIPPLRKCNVCLTPGHFVRCTLTAVVTFLRKAFVRIMVASDNSVPNQLAFTDLTKQTAVATEQWRQRFHTYIGHYMPSRQT